MARRGEAGRRRAAPSCGRVAVVATAAAATRAAAAAGDGSGAGSRAAAQHAAGTAAAAADRLGKVAEQAFTARTLAWAGGVATALGIVLLFVMAASRGWVTPEMRVGLGLIVSLGLLGAAVELDRRAWRADAILAAAGVGIAGLYATLWASTSLYGFFGAGSPRCWLRRSRRWPSASASASARSGWRCSACRRR